MNDESMSVYFRHKTVLITGASSGIGEAFARALADRGANLILAARSSEKLASLKRELSDGRNIKIHTFKIDLSTPSGPFDLYEMVSKAGLSIDILINNAGMGKQGSFEVFEPLLYEHLMQLNMVSVVVLSRLFIPHLLKKGSGGVINISSTAAFQPLPYFAIYAATKAFVLSFSEALWAEYRNRRIKILAVCPGHVRTNFHSVAGVSEKKLFAVVTPQRLVEDALKAYMKGVPCRVYGVSNFLLVLLIRFLPRKSVIKIAQKIFEPA